MIDDVRTTVLAVLNKNNYGYLSPMDFNLYAKQAQLEIFENLFYQYNNERFSFATSVYPDTLRF